MKNVASSVAVPAGIDDGDIATLNIFSGAPAAGSANTASAKAETTNVMNLRMATSIL